MDIGNILVGYVLFWLAPIGSVAALYYAYKFFQEMKSEDRGTESMKEIADAVRSGAIAYIKQQYTVVALFFVAAFLFLFFLAFVLGVQSKWVPFAFLTGGFFSGLCGYIGLSTATHASDRTTNAAKKSLNEGLRVAFRSGAVMGLCVVGLGLLDISIWYIVLRWIMGYDLHTVTVTMLCFGMGASSQALFARVGGGIFTKAADVGADLVGKVEAGIPEDDPRNPATIADNVGDNVGDVAGMGADLYESYCGSILASAALGVAAGLGVNGVILPLLIAAAGIVFSIKGIYLVRTEEKISMKELLKALDRGINASAIYIAIACLILVPIIIGFSNIGIAFSIIAGLLVGIVIGKGTEYFTANDFKPTQHIAKQSTTGPATTIIAGIGVGMMSTAVAVSAIAIGVLCAFAFAGGFSNTELGLYGIGIAAVGMLSTLGITLATDAYGPIADNAGGNAEMTHQEPIVRERTDALDSLGNTTAATGKGFAIGSAALTAMALLAAYIEELRAGLVRIGITTMELERSGKIIEVAQAKIADFMAFYNVTLMNPIVLVGLFIGAGLPFVFASMTMNAVGRAANLMVQEVRRQFREKPGIMEGTEKPDYARCVTISTKAAQKEMILPSLMAIIMPILVGVILGPGGVMGLLVGALMTGFVLAIFMANAGGAWDNAKKWIEKGEMGGKGSEEHKATVIGDTVGDPFKDTSGPSLNILIKLMSMVSVVVAGLVVAYSIF